MTRVNIHIEDREGGRYFVKVESSYPNQRNGEAFGVGIDAAIDKVREFCREFGVDDAKALPTMRPALQADIDRAEAAQQAAGDVESAKAWRDGSMQAINPAMASATGVTREMIDAAEVMTFAPIEGREAVEFVDASEIANRQPVWHAQRNATEWPSPGDVEEPVKRKPGRPRKEA